MRARRNLGRWVSSLAWTNAVVLLAAGLIHAAGFGGPGQLGRLVAQSLVTANVVAVPCLLLLPGLLARLPARRRSTPLAISVGVLLFVLAGGLASQTLLLAAGQLAARDFWPQYAVTMQFAVPLALASAFGAWLYDSLQDRARDAEQALLEARVAEQRSRQLATAARLRSLESRLQPHFLFNTLNSISSLIATDAPRAERLVLRLSSLLRASLDATSRPLVPLADELALVADYVAIEQARFGERLRADVDVAPELGRGRVPPLSVQSLVENAVKHGLVPQRGEGRVSVRAFRRDDRLVVEVADTGPGFDLAAIPAGHGLEALVERLDALFGDRASLAVSRRDGGCVVEMSVPWD